MDRDDRARFPMRQMLSPKDDATFDPLEFCFRWFSDGSQMVLRWFKECLKETLVLKLF